jgi:hypothetical protein
MCEPNVCGKEISHLPNLIGVWAKLCHAKRTFVITRESPPSVLGCDEAGSFPHGQSLRFIQPFWRGPKSLNHPDSPARVASLNSGECGIPSIFDHPHFCRAALVRPCKMGTQAQAEDFSYLKVSRKAGSVYQPYATKCCHLWGAYPTDRAVSQSRSVSGIGPRSVTIQ